mgnify:CR=1 FL=1
MDKLESINCYFSGISSHNRHSRYQVMLKNVSTEKELLADLKKMGVDLDFMRSTSDMTQEISLIGAADNILKGHEIKAQLKKAKDQLKILVANPKMIDRMMNLEGSDSFNTIKEKNFKE